jgi:hypothetical protein
MDQIRFMINSGMSNKEIRHTMRNIIFPAPSIKKIHEIRLEMGIPEPVIKNVDNSSVNFKRHPYAGDRVRATCIKVRGKWVSKR